MEAGKVQLVRCDLEKHKTELTKFVVAHFSDNPLMKLLPVPENERAEFYGDLLVNGNMSLLAFYEDELVGCRTGDIHTYEAHLAIIKMFTPMPFDHLHENCNRLGSFFLALELDLKPYGLGVTPQSQLYAADTVTVSPKMRNLKIGTRLIEESIKLARENGAHFYTVAIVNSYAKKSFDKLQFECIKVIKYAEYFAAQPEILTRIDPDHTEAYYMIKRL